MNWLPTENRSGRLLVLGVLVVWIGVLFVVIPDSVVSHTIARPVALALTVTGVACMAVGLLMDWSRFEKWRRQRKLPLDLFYRRLITHSYHSLRNGWRHLGRRDVSHMLFYCQQWQPCSR